MHGQVAHFGGPVVHLGVDVDCVLAIPGRFEVLIPKALQIGGLRSRTADRDQKIQN